MQRFAKAGQFVRRPVLSGLWHHRDFRRFWLAQSITQLGTQITFLAIPLTAILILEATPGQMGILLAVMGLPALLVSLFIGVWVDRLRRRPLLIASNLSRAVVLTILPVMAVTGVLGIVHLYIITFVHGTLFLLFNIAYRSYLPVLIGRDKLVEGNSKLELSRSAADISGPGVAGFLVQIITAPFAVLIQAAGLLVSSLLLTTIDATEPEPVPEPNRRIWRDAMDGLRFVFGHPILRPLAGCGATFGFMAGVVDVVILLYIVNELGLSAGMVGLVFSAGNIGFLIGALMPQRMVHLVGLGPALVFGIVITGVGDLIIPLASGPLPMVLAMLAAGQLMFGAGITIYRVNEVSLRQKLTPDRIQGRMNATMSLMLYGIMPAGALAGGILGTSIGLRETYLLAASCEILAVLWLVLSPVWSLKTHPEPIENG
jgi:MFS family permease